MDEKHLFSRKRSKIYLANIYCSNSTTEALKKGVKYAQHKQWSMINISVSSDY